MRHVGWRCSVLLDPVDRDGCLCFEDLMDFPGVIVGLLSLFS